MIKSSKYFSLIFTLILLISCESESFNVPGKTTLISPENVQICETGVSISDTQSEVTFSWSESEYTDYYDLNIINLNSNLVIWSSKNKLTSDKVVLVKGQPYSWKVISKNTSTTQTGTSSSWKFYLAGQGIKNYAPFPADLKAPTSGSTISRSSDGKITFTWEGSDPDQGDELKYTLYIDKTDGKQSPASDLTNISAKTVDVALDAGTLYYWRVKTSDGNNSSFSIVYSFRTQ